MYDISDNCAEVKQIEKKNERVRAKVEVGTILQELDLGGPQIHIVVYLLW